MKCFPTSPLLSLFIVLAQSRSLEPRQNSNSTDCRNVPGSAGYPSPIAWNVFNATIFGRLLEVVPPAKYCDNLPAGGCTDAQWTSVLFRGTIPRAMSYINWEQGYDLDPPSLCLRNGTTCGQGDLPVYSVEVETIRDVQQAQSPSGRQIHRTRWPWPIDCSNSLLIRVSKFQNVSSTDDFYVGGENMGSAVTIGSGVHTNTIYQHNKGQGKFSVVAAAETVAPAGGQIHGGGHSPLSPAYGLVSDNALGGGAGSWGVIISATIRTFPNFNTTSAITVLQVPNNTVVGSLATLHAQHVFDWDSVQAGHFFWFEKTQIGSTDPNVPTSFMLFTYMPNTTAEQSQILLAPFINALLALPGVVFISQTFKDGKINNVMFGPYNDVGGNVVLGSRLVPEALYRDSPERLLMTQLYWSYTQAGGWVGPAPGGSSETCMDLYPPMTQIGLLRQLLGQMVSGVSKTVTSRRLFTQRGGRPRHISCSQTRGTIRPLSLKLMRFARCSTTQLPLLEKLSGPNAGAYSNEADGSEPDFQSTFFGPNYAKLSDIKAKYDPHDLFIVAAGVGSERWDEWGLCKV
ncbi:hypothetical protein B0H14DRAFT_3752549 [Mycena olivaceomarginata]|nr:hypothetical protein B0H14DRAFT_3752549 [Mycena olivaceomarginata]